MIQPLSTDFLIVLPECLQLLIISLLLGFALAFTGGNTQPQAKFLKVSGIKPDRSLLNPDSRSTQVTPKGVTQGSLVKVGGPGVALGSSTETLSLAPLRPTEDFNGTPQTEVQTQNNLPSKATQQSWVPYTATDLVPYLQVEPMTKLTLTSLIWCAYVYTNITLENAFCFEALIWDHLSKIMTVIVCLSAASALLCGCESLKRFSRYEFLLILWLSILGMLWLIKSAHFLALYLSIELQSLSFYMLASMRSRNEASAEAGLKYFILSAFSSAILLLGSTLIYGAIGSQSFADLDLTLNHFATLGANGHNVGIPTGLSVGLGCVCVSLYFKLGAAPFHTWVADVYEGSLTAVTAFFALTAKIAVAAALTRQLSNTCPEELNQALSAVAVLSLMVGSLSAMRQVKLKRLLAFSGVANVGWLLLALAAGQWQLLVIHLIVYILLNLILFSVILMPLFRTHPDLSYGQRVNNAVVPDYGVDSLTVKYISDLHQIAKINPSIAISLTIAMFSLAGLPPLVGFYSKYLILNSLTQSEFYGILAFALATAVLSAFYYVRVVRTVYFSSTGPAANRNLWFTLKELPVNANLISWSCALTVCAFLKPDYFFIWLALG